MFPHKHAVSLALVAIAIALVVDLFSIGYKDRFAGMGTGGLIAGMLLTVVVFLVLSIGYLFFTKFSTVNIVVAAFIALLPAQIHFAHDLVDEWNHKNLTPIHLFKRCFGKLPPEGIEDFDFVELPKYPFASAFQFQLEDQPIQELLQSQGYEVFSVEDLSRDDAQRVAEYAEMTPWDGDQFYQKRLYDDSRVFVLTDEAWERCLVCEVSPRAPSR